MTAASTSNTLAGLSDNRGRKFKDRFATTLVYGSFLVALVPLIWLLWTVLSRGLHAITRDGWFTRSQRGTTYRTPGGGALHAIIGTVEQVALCTLISVPIALLVAIYLVEYGRGPLARATTPASRPSWPRCSSTPWSSPPSMGSRPAGWCHSPW